MNSASPSRRLTAHTNRSVLLYLFFFLNDPAPTEIYPFPLPAALPIWARRYRRHEGPDEARELLFRRERLHPGHIFTPPGQSTEQVMSRRLTACSKADFEQPRTMQIGRAHV